MWNVNLSNSLDVVCWVFVRPEETESIRAEIKRFHVHRQVHIVSRLPSVDAVSFSWISLIVINVRDSWNVAQHFDQPESQVLIERIVVWRLTNTRSWHHNWNRLLDDKSIKQNYGTTSGKPKWNRNCACRLPMHGNFFTRKVQQRNSFATHKAPKQWETESRKDWKPLRADSLFICKTKRKGNRKDRDQVVADWDSFRFVNRFIKPANANKSRETIRLLSAFWNISIFIEAK